MLGFLHFSAWPSEAPGRHIMLLLSGQLLLGSFADLLVAVY